ncbi:MAG: thiamine phosphate synthase [Acidobacteriota bacterium]|nr:thiamine phosphate synthase [Acidobacteriota bacterium]
MAVPPVYPILDTASLASHTIHPVEAAEAFLEGGAQILQFRHKEFWSRQIFEMAKKIADLCRQTEAVFVVNDRADYAALAGAGLHVGQDDLTPEDARRVIGNSALLGFSTHNADQIRGAQNQPVDYVAFGPVFPTLSKLKPDPTAGMDGLRAARSLTTKPLVAIGGITRHNAAACWAAGATSVAVIGDLIPVPCTKRALRDRMAEWQRLN